MRFREHRRGYNRPSANVERSVVVGVRHAPTRPVLEFGLRLAVGPLRVAAFVARAAGVPRVDGDDGSAGEPRFVFEKHPQLREGPSAQTRSLIVPVPCSGANAAEILDGQSAPGVCSRGNELFGDAMVLVAAEASFLRTQAFERTPDVLRPTTGIALRVGFV